MKIALGGDHAGFEYKQKIIQYLKKKNFDIIDYGPSNNQSCDYPEFSHLVAAAVKEKKVDFGILVCGSANGVAMAANKHNNVRAAICWDDKIASLAKTHNNANIICFPARFVSFNSVILMLNKYLENDFKGGRHLKRVRKINL